MKFNLKRESHISKKGVLAELLDVDWQSFFESLKERVGFRQPVDLGPIRERPDWMVPIRGAVCVVDMEKAALSTSEFWRGNFGQKIIQDWRKAVETHGSTTLQKPDGTTFKIAGQHQKDDHFPVISVNPPTKAAPATPAP